MSTLVRVPIIKIGNSRGVRLPANLLKENGFGNEAELHVNNGQIVIEKVQANPRQGWADAARAMHNAGHDNLYIDDHLDLDTDDWQW